MLVSFQPPGSLCWWPTEWDSPAEFVGHFSTILCLNEDPLIHVRQVNSNQLDSSFIWIMLNLSGFIWVHSSLVGGFEHFLFLHIGNFIIPTDFRCPSFFRGVSSNHQPASFKKIRANLPFLSYFFTSHFLVVTSSGRHRETGSSAADGLRGGGSQGVFISWLIHLGKL